MVKKISLVVIIAVGVVWAAATFILNLWGKSPSLDHLTHKLKPAFSNSGLQQETGDVAAVHGVVTEVYGTTVPFLAKSLNVTPGDVVGVLSRYDAVGKVLDTKDNEGKPYADGKSYLQHADAYLMTVGTALKANQDAFKKTSDIPTNNLPTIALSYLFLIIGLLAIGLGVLYIRKPALAIPVVAGSAALALIVIVVTFVLDVPGKTQGADDLTNTFRPVFSKSGPLSIDEGQKYLDAVSAANKALTANVVPLAAGLFGVSDAAVTKVLATNSPKLVNALIGKDKANPKENVLAGIITRFDGLAATVKSERSDFSDTDAIPGLGMPTTMVQFLLVAPAILVLLAAIGLALPGAPKPTSDPAKRRPTPAGTRT